MIDINIGSYQIENMRNLKYTHGKINHSTMQILSLRRNLFTRASFDLLHVSSTCKFRGIGWQATKDWSIVCWCTLDKQCLITIILLH